MGRTVLVSGGAGFIGGNLVRLIRETRPQDSILVLDRLTYAADPQRLEGLDGVELVVGDIQDEPLVRSLIERHQVRQILHLAAESHVDRSISGPADFVLTNVVGTFRLLEAARAVWHREEDCRFLYVSTDEVYGSLGETGCFSELDPLRPNSPYSASKAAGDHFVRAYAHTYGINTVITRCSNNYGPGQHPEKLIPLAITRMVQAEPVPIYGNGMNVRDWLYVDDHCAGLLAALDRGGRGETYNFGGRNEWPNLELLRQVARLVDQALGRAPGDSERLFTFVEDRPGHDWRYAIDPSKAMAELGWQSATGFLEGLSRTVDWYLRRLRG